MTHPVRVRESLAESRDAGWSFAEAWAVVLDEDPLEDFMEGYFPEGRDSEGQGFAAWCESLWKAAYESKPLSRGQKATRLEPHGARSLAVRDAYRGPQAPALPVQREHVARCRAGRGCERPATHGRFRHFCQPCHAVLVPIVEAFEREEAARSEALGNRAQVAA